MENNIQRIYQEFLKHRKISTDTRKIEKDSIFFALKGENFNGNKFTKQAIESGASLAVVDEIEFCFSEKCVLVNDVLEALQQLASHHRSTLQIPVVAITGSNGKTTTKELIRSVLQKKFKTIATKGNLNNHIGVPLTLLGLPDDTEMAVIEMGANHQHEIGPLCEIAKPTHGIITNVGLAHIEGFGGFEGVKKGKGEMYDFLSANMGTAFVNMDNAHLMGMSEKVQQKIFYGTTENADVIGKLIEEHPFLKLNWKAKSDNLLHKTDSQISGKYNFENILAAICIGNYFRINAEDISKAVAEYLPSEMRSQIIQKNSNTIILDAYNANPTSMNAAIESFSSLKVKKKITILGDMMELGEYSSAEHKAITEKLKKENYDIVILVGNKFAEHKLNLTCLSFETAAEVCDWFKANPAMDSAILIKGSRKVALEKIVECI